MAKHTLTDAEILAQIPAARARAQQDRKEGRVAVSAGYDRKGERIVLELSNGVLFGFPVTSVRALDGMTPAQLRRVTLSPSGSLVSWESEDVDLSVPGLLAASVGAAVGMKVLGQTGGRVKSEAKAAASRANGAKGGRPRKKKAA